MNICVIPARGGSKRVPRKNIKLFCGKPMIAYAIEAAKKTSLFSHIIVSTDDDEVAEVARQFGAETPFCRPANLADDYTPTVPVISHAIGEVERLGWSFDKVCCLYATVPLIQSSNICYALDLLEKHETKYIFPVTEFPSAVQRALKRLKNGQMMPFYPQYELTRSQDLEKAFYDAGQFYWATKRSWQTIQSIYENGVGLVVPRWLVVDIDTVEDWHFAELLYEIGVKRNG